VRIGGHLHAHRAPCSHDLRDAGDERRGESAPSIVRINEQVFQFYGADFWRADFCGAGGLGPGRKADNGAVRFRDVRAAFGQSLRSQDQVFRGLRSVVPRGANTRANVLSSERRPVSWT
jgi:hypothetical protein